MQRKRKILLVAATVLLPVSLAIAGSSSPAGAAVASGPAAVNGEFNAVSASSASDAWAVGCLNASGNPDTCPEIGSNLAEHWNGKTWTRVTVPAPAVATEAHSQTLTAVADISPTDVWVIGTVDTEYAAVPEAAHWNGKTWSRMKTPSVPYEGGDAGLTAIAGSSPSSVWAVGVGGPTASYNFPVQLYWNGRKWSNETYRRLPVPPEGYGLQGVETTSPASAWASAETGSGRLLRWNGKAWISVSIAGGAWLTGVSGVSADNVWAVGNFEGYGSGKGAAIYHWNGKAWTRSA